eukprot:CAMPEP_0179454980 /NCGR_PEP_ID=MMETSP0799-20121207/38963_1 /TAXON_ID=46947 /ORGANISM="Geminigera cryophila, Strain CCMP2564" /LENGTH=83 /DNA_ID=CAMNT_0021253639 /DNA_START=92 /DNA_END=344 /DNA_ORIENTATION=-
MIILADQKGAKKGEFRNGDSALIYKSFSGHGYSASEKRGSAIKVGPAEGCAADDCSVRANDGGIVEQRGVEGAIAGGSNPAGA